MEEGTRYAITTRVCSIPLQFIQTFNFGVINLVLCAIAIDSELVSPFFQSSRVQLQVRRVYSGFGQFPEGKKGMLDLLKP